MSISAMAGRRMTLSRRTAFTLERGLSPFAADYAPDRATDRDSYFEVTISGAGTGGLLTINGIVNLLSVAEGLTFTGPGTKVSENRFDAGSVTTYDNDGGFMSGQTIAIVAVGSDGSRRHMHTTVGTAIRTRIDRGRGQWFSPAAGRIEYEKTRAYMDYTTLFTPREGDVLQDEVTLEEYEIKTHPDMFGGGSATPHHWEMEVERRKQAITT